MICSAYLPVGRAGQWGSGDWREWYRSQNGGVGILAGLSTVEPDRSSQAERPSSSRSEAGEPDGGTVGGGMTTGRVAVLVAAVAFLAGAVGWAVGGRSVDPLNAADVGFMQDMSLHHEQAIQMSLVLLSKDDVDPELQRYAQEIVISQRFDQGVFNATLDRFGHSSDTGGTVMEWMGHAMPAAEMPGLASPEQMSQLKAATGRDAAALWIALMSQHHLGGIEMAQAAAEAGSDRTVVNIANGNARIQADEILELSRYRRRNDLSIPEGFSDPTQDPAVVTRQSEIAGG